MGKEWSKNEIKVLESEYPRKSAKELASDKLEDRSPTAVRNKASRLGIKSEVSSNMAEKPDSLDMSDEKWKGLDPSTRHYYRNKDRVQKEKNRMNRERRKRRVNWLREIKEDMSCQLCGEEDRVALDFHHLGKKEDSVSQMVADLLAIEKVLKELSKCAVVCANCHRKIHHGHKETPMLERIDVSQIQMPR